MKIMTGCFILLLTWLINLQTGIADEKGRQVCSSVIAQEVFSISGNIAPTGEKGVLIVWLIQEENFGVQGAGLDKYTAAVNGEAAMLHFQFDGIPSGRYALRAYLDTNENGRLDSGLFGPTEPWALSWRTDRHRLPPKFSDIAFTVAGDTEINLRF